MVKCSRCGVEIADSFELCPNCGNDLTKKPEDDSQGLTNHCPECGSAINDDALFCPECGFNLSNDGSESSHKACPNCGEKITADSLFCDSCGFDLNNNKKKSNPDLAKIVSQNSKIIILAGVILVLIIAAICLVGFSSGNNMVNVTDVGIYDDYSGGPFGGAVSSAITMREEEAQNPGSNSGVFGGSSSGSDNYDIRLGVKISLVPYETIEDVESIEFKNIEITYSDGSVQTLKDVSFSGKNLMKDSRYPFAFNYNLDQGLWNESIHLQDFYGKGHVKADIVINTTSQTDKLIGHIDNDVTSSG